MNLIRRPLRVSLYADGGLLLLTGIAWTLLHYRPQWLGQSARDAVALNAMLMRVHGAAAMYALALLGALLVGHVQSGWRAARNKWSGIAALALAGTLVLTGYALYYAGAEGARDGASLLHTVAGAALPVVIVAHALRLLRSRHRHTALARALHRKRRAPASAG